MASIAQLQKESDILERNGDIKGALAKQREIAAIKSGGKPITTIKQEPIEAKGLDVAKQMAVSAVAEPVKGLVGLGTMLTGGSNEDANQNMQYFQSAREKAFPQSAQGQTEAQAIAENPVMAAIGKGMDYISKGAGNVTYDVTGSPAVAAIAEGTPDATETVAGKAKIATTAIAQAGVNDTDIITALKLQQKINNVSFGINQGLSNPTTLANTWYTNTSGKVMFAHNVRVG